MLSIWPPKVCKQSYGNCSILCCYNIYICIRIKQNNDVNDFLHYNVELTLGVMGLKITTLSRDCEPHTQH